MMRVLVACEESQRVCNAFRARGHEAYSCDILHCSGGHPEWHIKSDVEPLLNGNCSFVTMDGKAHAIRGKWDMIIAFPPCTYLTNMGATRMFPKAGEVDKDRFEKAMEAKEFFLKILNADCEHIAVENPRPLTVVDLPRSSQIIQPWMFGHPFTKETHLWLKGLPRLKRTKLADKEVRPFVSGGSKDNKGNPRKKQGTTYRDSVDRSKTFFGVAEAMADQWGRDEVLAHKDPKQLSLFDV